MEDEGCLEGSASASTQGSVTESVGDLEPASIAIQEEKAKVPIYESGSEEDCIRGALLGLAWGDAFGCPVEGWKAGRIREVFGELNALPQEYPVEKAKIIGTTLATKLRPLGLYSDDTQQSLALINCCFVEDNEENIIKKPKKSKYAHKAVGALQWDVTRWTKCLSEGVNSRAFRGFGQNFHKSVAKLSKGASFFVSGSNSEGIGAAMRSGPIGCLFRNYPEILSRCAWESSLITHASIPSGALSFAVAWTVSRLVKGASVEEVRSELANRVSAEEKHWLLEEQEWKLNREHYHVVSQTLRTIFSECDLNNRDALRASISSNAKPYLGEGHVKAHVNQGFVLLGGIHAIVMALLPNINPQEILREVIVLGHDTDTVGAIMGSILGARFGAGWIPTDRLQELDRLEGYVDALVKGGISGQRGDSQTEGYEAFFKREKELTTMEYEYKQAMLQKCFPGQKKEGGGAGKGNNGPAPRRKKGGKGKNRKKGGRN